MDRLTTAMRSPTKGGSMASDRPSRAKSSASLRSSTPQSRLLGRGSLGSLRRLRSRMSLGSLRKGSPERKEVTRVSGHVTGGSPDHRRHSFRPLSIVNSALHPFDFDISAAMKAVHDQTLSSPSPSQQAASTDERAIMAPGQQKEEPLAQVPRLLEEEREDDEKTVKPGRSDEDLPAQASLAPLPLPPPPDLKDHPAFRNDGHGAGVPETPATAGATMTPRRAVRFVSPPELRRREAPQSSGARPAGGVSLRSSFSRLRLDEGAPMSSPTAEPKTPGDNDKQATTPASKGAGQKRTGLRKVTGLFKKSDKAQADPTSPLSEGSNSQRSKEELERHLRIVSNCRSYDYDPGQPYPRHPNTGRAWHSRNLKCTDCSDVFCGVCGRTCCAYKSASEALKNHKNNPPSLKVAQDRLVDISNLFPFGREVPTFLQCTHGGGCGKMICPDCCGQCPIPMCSDIQCRKCKKDPWSECEWH